MKTAIAVMVGAGLGAAALWSAQQLSAKAEAPPEKPEIGRAHV